MKGNGQVYGVHLVCFLGSTLLFAAATGYDNWALPQVNCRP